MTAALPALQLTRSSLAGRSSDADADRLPTLDDILSADPDRFVAQYTDIAAINLACAVGLPQAEGLDISQCLRSLDAMAHWVQKRTAGSWHIYEQDAERFNHSKNLFRVIIMLRFLHVQFGVHYNPLRIEYRDDNWDPTDTGDLFILGILSECRTGTCASLPIFAVAVGRRLGYPLKLVKVPDHLLFRWDDEHERFNVEYNGEGGETRPDDYYKTWPIEWTAEICRMQKHARWLTSLTPKREVAKCLENRFLALEALGRYDEALQCLLAAMKFNPINIPLYVGTLKNLYCKMLDGEGIPRPLVVMANSLLARHGYLRPGIHVGSMLGPAPAFGRVTRFDFMREVVQQINQINAVNGQHGHPAMDALNLLLGLGYGPGVPFREVHPEAPQPSPTTWPMPIPTQAPNGVRGGTQAANVYYPPDCCFETIVGLGSVQPREPRHTRLDGEKK